MKKNPQSHEFALYYPDLPKKINTGTTLTLSDSSLVMRIAHVLRLKPGQSVCLFDRDVHVRLSIDSITKKSIDGHIVFFEKNRVYEPRITLWLPLLKKESLEHAVYAAVESGVQEIQLIITEKVQRKWGGQKELERLNKIIIAAAEQSKNYAFPRIVEPQPLAYVCRDVPHMHKFFFDPHGSDALSVFQKKYEGELLLVVGPEGDLTDEEKVLLRDNKFVFCRLTPTILRAWSAVALAVGMVRSLVAK